MKLKEWMKRSGITCVDMQNDLNYGRDYLYRIISGKITPGKKLAMAISEYTKGKVSVSDLGYKEKVKCKCPSCGRVI